MRARVVALFLLLASLSQSFAHAQWQDDGLPVCVVERNQGSVAAVSDGIGGAFMVWSDGRNGPGDIYAQRLDGGGNALWTTNGVAVCTDSSEQSFPAILNDGTGGVIIAWHDWRTQTSNQDIYAQRLNGAGAPQWTANGVVVTAAASGQHYPMMVSNGAGGAIVVWLDSRPGMFSDVYGARLTAAGTLPDGPNGIAISTAAGNQTPASLIPYGGGGAIVAWSDTRTGHHDVFAARITSAGIVQDPTGIPICVQPGDQFYPDTISDGAGGAIITFSDINRAGEVYAQRINSSGIAQWIPNGIPVGGSLIVSSIGQQPKTVSDGAGGAIISWYRYDLSDRNVYAQRINGSGLEQWSANDIPVCTAASDQSDLLATADNAGGAVVAWTDPRAGTFGNDVYAQRVSPSGAMLWPINGAVVCDVELDQSQLAIVSDLSGGAIIAWKDRRTFVESDIYANRLASEGTIPTDVTSAPRVTSLGVNYPNPFNPATSIPFSLARAGRVTLRVFDVDGRFVAALLDEHRGAGTHVVRWDGRDNVGAIMSTGVYFARLESNGVTETRKLVLLK